MGINYNAKIVTSGLIFYLDAGNTKSYPGSGNTWNNQIDTSNLQTLSNTSFTANNGGCIVFNGTTSQSINNSPSLITGNNSFTKSAWIFSNYKGTSANHPNIISWGGNSNNNKNGLSLQTDASNNPQVLHWFYANDYAWSIADLTGSWNNVVVTYSSPTLTLYINGVSQGTKTVTGTPNVTNTNLEIGSFTSSTQYKFNGNISNIKVYNRALSEAEIQQNFNALRGRFGI